MAQNTKQRNEEIQQAAAALLTEKNVDVAKRVEIRPLAKILVERTGCHYTTAKNHVAQAVRRARGELVEAEWGGTRPDAGRPKKAIVTVATRSRVSNASKKYIVSGANETDAMMLSINNGDEIYVTEIGPAGESDIDDQAAIAHLNPVYWSYSIEQVVNQLSLK